jgi:hypothetical protein
MGDVLFSQRKGLTPLRTILQKNSMDDALRSGLWNILYLCVYAATDHNNMPIEYTVLNPLFRAYWHGYFKHPLDTLPRLSGQVNNIIRKYFFNFQWYEVYDFIEFTANEAPERLAGKFTKSCNNILEREMSAYRFVDCKILDMTSEEEIASIEDALRNTDKFEGVQTHLKAAVSLLADRKNPDFRNSIKESISAVEAVARILTGKPKATPGEALKILENNSSLHPALKSGFTSIYGWTSDAEGIRHAMMEESNITFEDAKFMLVSCTAFINYLIGKSAQANSKLT